MSRDFGVANDGSVTRVNRGTGGGSTPDVTLAHQSMLNKIEWSCLEDMGSDHLPILLELECGVSAVKQASPGLRWRWGKADWDGYRREVEQKVVEVKEEVREWSISKKSSFIVDTMLSAAKSHVGQAKPRATSKVWMTEEVKTAVKKRNLLRRTVGVNREERVEACRIV